MLSKLIPVAFIFIAVCANGQQYERNDTVAIYKAILHSAQYDSVYFDNRIWQGLNPLDVHGNVKLAYQRDRNFFADSSLLKVDGNPIIYRLPLITYLDSLGIKEDTSYLLHQVSSTKLDNLVNYIPSTDPLYNRIWPDNASKTLRKSAFKLFFSTIIFSKYHFAFVQVELFTYKRKDPIDQIVVLKKTDNEWRIMNIMNSKMWSAIPANRHNEWLTY